MHVLHVIDSLGLGGAERMLLDIANATVRSGHRVTVCITRSPSALASELDPSIEVVVLGRKTKLAPAAMVKLAGWIRRQRPDVMHVHLRSNMVFVLAVKLATRITTPIVFHDHYGTIEVDTAIPLWFRLGHRWIDQYVGVYERLCTWAREAGMPAARTITISNAIDLARIRRARPGRIREELELGNRRLGVLVATVRRDKEIELVAAALALSKHRESVCIAVAGGFQDARYLAEVRAAIAKHRVERSLVLLGPREDVPELLAAADLGLLSSHTESGPLVLIEYLAANLPIVATTVGDIGRRMAKAGVPGFVPPRDANAFAAQLDAILELSSSDRAARVAGGQAVLIGRWDIDTVIGRWLDLYEAAISR